MAQPRQPEEIVIVDAVSKDGTREFLEDWGRLVVPGVVFFSLWILN